MPPSKQCSPTACSPWPNCGCSPSGAGTVWSKPGETDNLLDVTRPDVTRPTLEEVDGPVIVTKLHAQHPPRWITAEADGTYTSVTGFESQEYMDDAANHEFWTRSSLAARFPWVGGFLTAATRNDVARFDDASGAYTLERD